MNRTNPFIVKWICSALLISSLQDILYNFSIIQSKYYRYNQYPVIKILIIRSNIVCPGAIKTGMTSNPELENSFGRERISSSGSCGKIL